jgi:branched-chain amino acid transport system substrate-binding protein
MGRNAGWTVVSLATAIAVRTACSADSIAQGTGISDGVVKIGLILDLSGAYADITGAGTVTAVKMAIEDFGGKVLGKPIEVVAADH